MSQIFIVFFYLLNFIHSSSVITITATNSVQGRQYINIMDSYTISIRRIGNNKVTLTDYNYYYDVNVEPGTYEINITTDKKSLSLSMLLGGDFCNFDSIVIKNPGDKITITDLSYAFWNCVNLKSIDFTELDMSGVIYFQGIFYACHSLVSINFGSTLLKKLQDMSYMFYECISLISINLSIFDTSDVINMSCMFYLCKSLISINLSSFDTSNVKDMSFMFYDCYKLTSINLLNFDTSNVINMKSMFSACSSLISINLSNFNTLNVKDMSYMFYQCSSLISINLSSFNTLNVNDMSYMFYECSSLISINLSSFDTSNVTNFESMFKNCYSLSSLDLSNFNAFKAKNMKSMFYICSSLTYINIDKFDALSENDMSEMFYGCNSLTSIHFNKFIAKKVIKLDKMFFNCNKLQSLDLSNFYTSLTTSMDSMFSGCTSLNYLNINNFNTSLVTNMNNMFKNCELLTSLNLSSFNIKEGANIDFMFYKSSEYIIYCINDISFTKIESQLKDKKCAIRDYNCLNGWSEIPKKIIDENGECVNDCNSTEKYKYEYNGKCYSACPKGTTTYFNKNNNLVCQSFEIEEILQLIKNENQKEKETQEIITEQMTEQQLIEKITTEKMITEKISEEITIEKITTEKITEKLISENITTEKTEAPKIIIDNNNNNLIYNKYCSPKNFFKKECTPYKQVQKDDNMIVLIKNDISEGKLDSIIEEVLNKKKDKIESYENIIYQITTTFNQKNNEYKDISTLEFEGCEDVLKNIYNISKNDSLIIFKYEYIIPELLIPIIGYELYHSNTKQILDLNYCRNNNTKINILIPVQINEKEEHKHNPKDIYYKDKCNTDSNNNSIDITIYDKKIIYNEKNLALCAKNCEFDVYNNSTKKVKCICEPQFNNSLLTLDDIINKKKLINNFIDIHSSTNFDVIKCYKKFLLLISLKSNIGSYIILSIILIYIIGSFIFSFCEYKKIMNKVDDILKDKGNNNSNINDITIELNNPIKKKNKIIKINKIINIKNNVNNSKINTNINNDKSTNKLNKSKNKQKPKKIIKNQENILKKVLNIMILN